MNSFHNKFAEFIFQIYSFISYRPTRTAAGEGERGSVRRITRLYTHDFGGGGGMTLIPSDAAGKAINRESIFELLPRHPLPSETVASWRNEYFNTCERISSRHHLLPPLLPHIYIYLYTHTPAFPYGFNTEEHLSLSCTLHSSSVAQLNRPARVRLLARCVTPPPLPPIPLFPFLPPFPSLAVEDLEGLASLEDRRTDRGADGCWEMRFEFQRG